MKDPKAEIVRLNLGELARYVPLSEAHVMTLGGEGVEAKTWQDLGISHQNGWLIERNRSRGGKLIKKFSYRSHNELRTFPKILAGLYGNERAFIDYAHIDIYGTLTEDVIDDFTPVLPLVFKGRGRCLAVTVADSRRNIALEQWPHIVARGDRLFGSRKAKYAYQSMLEVQKDLPTNEDIPETFVKFNPENGAKREFGLLVQFAEVLQSLGFDILPSFMERYVYVSRYSGRPFRMRTYFFRFESKRLARPARALARAWIKSRLSFANSDGFQEIHRAHIRKKRFYPKNKPKKGMINMPSKAPETTQTSKLAQFVSFASPEIQAEYQALVAKVGLAEKIGQVLSDAGIVPRLAMASTEPPSILQHRRRGRPPGSGNHKALEDFDAKELIALRIEALELRASVNGEWMVEKKQFLQKHFGHCNANLARRFGGLIARTSGDYREAFRRTVIEVFGEEGAKPYLERLDKLPMKYHE